MRIRATDFPLFCSNFARKCLILRQNAHSNNCLFCSKFCRQNLSKPTAHTDQNFTSVNEHAMLGGVYFFSFEFNKVSDTTILHLLCFVVNMHHILLIHLFLEGKRMSFERLFLECESGHDK